MRSRFVDRVLHESEVAALDALFLQSVRDDQDELSFVEGHRLRPTEGGSPHGVAHLCPNAGRTVVPQTVSVPKITHALHFLSTVSSTGVDDASRSGREQQAFVEWLRPPEDPQPVRSRRTYQQGNLAQVEIVEDRKTPGQTRFFAIE